MLTPAAWTRTSTSSAPVIGRSISANARTSGVPYCERTIARIVAVVAFAVARRRDKLISFMAVMVLASFDGEGEVCGGAIDPRQREVPNSSNRPMRPAENVQLTF